MTSIDSEQGNHYSGDSHTFDIVLYLVQERLRQSLGEFADSPNFLAKMQSAFGESFAPEAAFSLAKDWGKGDVTVPSIEILSAATLSVAYGGYASSTNTIYLSEKFLRDNTLSAITSGILEEFGHSIDQLLNTSDTLGDEGQIFAALVQGIALPESQLQALKQENDFTTICIDGQEIQIEQAAISGDGGQGGTTQTISLESQGLSLVKFRWENYEIPDEFQILYEGKRIAGNVGLQSGGGSGERVVAKKNANELTVKVTAPLEGTAWDFDVETIPLEITINGLLGDVVQVDLVNEFTSRGISLQDAGLDPNGFGLKSNNNNRGQVAQIDDFQKALRTGKFYFVPTVDGTPRQLNQARNDDGIGESTLTITNGEIEFPIKFNITDGFSSTGDNRVTVGTQRLDIYRQEQRLSYLSFQQQTGSNLVVDGNISDLPWAIKLFNIATSQSPLGPYANGGRGRVANHPSILKESEINSSNAPQWTNLNGIQNFTFVGTQRRFGTNSSASAIQGATNTLGSNINSTGVTGRNGSGDPSTSHDGGRGVDIDTIPREAYDAGRNFFLETRINNVWYVAAPTNQIIVRNPNGTYQAAAPTPQNLVNAVRGNQAFNNQQVLNGISGFLQDNSIIGYSLNDIQALIQSFQNTGLAGRVLYNDPRTWGGVVGFSSGHNGHVHFEIKTPALGANATGFNLRSSNIEDFSPELSVVETSTLISPLAAVSVFSNLSNAIELGQLEGHVNLNGTISSTNPDICYRFTLGNPIEVDEAYFLTLRNFSLLLNGLSADVDVEIIQDFNGDNIRQDYEVVASSEEIGNSNETIELTDLSLNVYYVRVFQKSGDTNYNLTLTVPPLPVPLDSAGNTPSNAQDLGTLSGNLTRTDFIGEVDPDDYYRFNLAALSDLRLEVSGLDQGDLVATLEQDTNNDGAIDFDETIALSDAEGNEAEAININGLAAGTYYVRLSPNSGNTDYNMNLSATPAVIPPDRAGSTLSTAFDIGSLSSEYNIKNFVGSVDPEDYYRFSIGNVSGLTIQLDGLSADADLELAQDTNNDGVIDYDEINTTSDLSGTDAEVIDIRALAAGTYFVRVHQYEGDTNYNLSFTPTNAVGSDLSVTRTDDTGAVDLGQQYAYTLSVTNNGPSTANNVILTERLPSGVNFISATATAPSLPSLPLNYLDFLKFQLNAGDRAIIDLDASEFGSSLDSVLRLFDSAGTEVAYSDQDPAPNENFSNDSYLDFTAAISDIYYLGISSFDDSSYDPFNGSPIGFGYTSGNYTLHVSIGTGGSTNQVVLSEPNNIISQAIETNLSSVSPGTFVGTGFIRTSDSATSVSNGFVTAILGALNSGESAAVNLIMSTFSSGALLSTVSVAGTESDYNQTNNFLVSTKTVNSITSPDADLELTQTVDNSNPVLGDQVTFTLTLTNQGPGTATVIKVGDTLPAGISYVSALSDLGSYDSNTGIWNVGNMPPDQSVSLRITAVVNSGQLLTNTAEVIAVDEGDPDSIPNNNDPNEDDQAAVVVNGKNNGPATFSINGKYQVGQTLLAVNTAPDPDGSGVFSYLWETSSNGTTWTGTGSNNPSLLLTNNEANKRVRLNVFYTDGKGFNESVSVLGNNVQADTSQKGDPVYRFFKKGTGSHLYTQQQERDILLGNPITDPITGSLVYEGPTFTEITDGVATQRFFNASSSTHINTIVPLEQQLLKQSPDWVYEGESYEVSRTFIDGVAEVEAYRFRNIQNGAFLYSVEPFEINILNNNPSFLNEGIAFYVGEL